ncbi:MAG TPA: Error-prone repair protein ImuA, partial [Chitinophagaceae bacterium]
SLKSDNGNDMPGIGFPRWQVNLLKIRNGKPGNWQIEYKSNQFRSVADTPVVEHQIHRKAV